MEVVLLQRPREAEHRCSRTVAAEEQNDPGSSAAAGTVDDSLARQVFKEAGYKPVSNKVTLGVIKGASASACPFK